MQDADPQAVQRTPDPIRAHPVSLGRQPVARVLEAAEGHVADGDVRTDPARLPVEDRPDPQVVPVRAEAGLDLRQPAVLDDQVARVILAAAPCHDSPQPVPAGRLGHLRPFEAHPAVGEVEEPGGAAAGMRGRGAASLQRRAQPVDPALPVPGVLPGAPGRMGDDQPAPAVLDAQVAADRPREFVPVPPDVAVRVEDPALPRRRTGLQPGARTR